MQVLSATDSLVLLFVFVLKSLLSLPQVGGFPYFFNSIII